MAQNCFSAWIQTLLSCSAVTSRQVHRSQVHFSPINMLPRVIFKCWEYIKLKCHDSVFSIDFVSCPSRWWNRIGNHILHKKIPGKKEFWYFITMKSRPSYLTALFPMLHILVEPHNYRFATETHVRIFLLFFHLKRLYFENGCREVWKVKQRFLFSCCRWRSCWNCLCSWPPPHPPSPCLHSQCQWAQGEHLLQHSWQPHPQHSNWTDLQRKWVSSLRPKHANRWYIDTIRKETLACSLALARCCLWRGCTLPRTLSSDMLQGEKLFSLSK